jgi:hypothetical protein
MNIFTFWNTYLLTFLNSHKPRIKAGLRIAEYVVLAILLYIAFLHFFGPKPEQPKPATYTIQAAAETPQGIKLAANEQNVAVTRHQAEEAAEGIKNAANEKPFTVVTTTAGNVGQEVEKLKEKYDGDIAIVTDPKNPTKPAEPAKLDPATPIKLDAHIIKAYPKAQVIVTIDDESYGIGYVREFKVGKVPILLPHGATGYVGPYIRHDRGTPIGELKDTHYGAALTVTF